MIIARSLELMPRLLITQRKVFVQCGMYAHVDYIDHCTIGVKDDFIHYD